jgi:hypothetical protein
LGQKRLALGPQLQSEGNGEAHIGPLLGIRFGPMQQMGRQQQGRTGPAQLFGGEAIEGRLPC